MCIIVPVVVEDPIPLSAVMRPCIRDKMQHNEGSSEWTGFMWRAVNSLAGLCSQHCRRLHCSGRNAWCHDADEHIGGNNRPSMPRHAHLL